MQKQQRWTRRALAGWALSLLVACGGGDDGSNSPDTAFTVGGTVSGLGSGKVLVLQNNGGEELTVSGNGGIAFATRLVPGAAYAVTIKTQPSGQTCTVANGSGTADADVGNVAVTCQNQAPNTYTVGGSVSGLGAGKALVLQNNGGNDLSVSANGGFTFSVALAVNTGYSVTVKSQPSGQTCAVANGSGTASANVSNVALSCQNNTNPPPPVGTLTPLYEGKPYTEDRNSFLTQVNAQGARGFGLYGSVGSGAGDFIYLYAKAGSATYSYELLDLPTSEAAMLAQENAQGARGYHSYGNTTSGALYVKSSADVGPFRYEHLPYKTVASDFLVQANAQGARGFYYAGNYILGGNTFSIYVNDSSSAVYSYQLLPLSTLASSADFLAQANAQGQQGYLYIGASIFLGSPPSDQYKNMYVKDSTQNPRFEYKLMPGDTSSSALVTQANAEGANGYFFGATMMFMPSGPTQPGDARNLYVKPSNCSGTVLCRAVGPL